MGVANDYFNATKDRYIQFNSPYKDKFAQKLNKAINERVKDEFAKQEAYYIDKLIDSIQLHFDKNPIKL